MADRDALRDHLGAMIDAYRGGGAATWRRIESDTRELGEHSAFTTVRWNALDADGNMLRDARTTYHLLATRGCSRTSQKSPAGMAMMVPSRSLSVRCERLVAAEILGPRHEADHLLRVPYRQRVHPGSTWRNRAAAAVRVRTPSFA
jgi:hypothetical protein